MLNKAGTISLSPAGRARRLAAENQSWIRAGGAGVIGYVMAGSFLFGGISPFATALCAALIGADATGAAAGAVLGYLLGGNMLPNFKYIAALGLVICAKWLLNGKAEISGKITSSVLVCLVSFGACAGVFFALGERTPYHAILGFSELFLACGATYFFARARTVIPIGIQGAGRADLSCMVISGCILLMGLTSIDIAGLSLGRVLGVLLILICARYSREAGGAICGIAVGVSVGLAGGSISYVIGAYGFGGLIAGVFGQMGRFAAATAFIAVNTLSALLIMDFSGVNTAIFEVFAACLVFIAIPSSLLARFSLSGVGSAAHSDAYAQITVAERLDDISGALLEISSTIRAVSQKLASRGEPEPSSVCERVTERVCARCGMKTNCWQLRHSVVNGAMRDCVNILRRDGVITLEQMPRHFHQHCCRMKEIVADLNAQFASYLARDSAARKVARVRAVLNDQFEGIALMLGELGGELCSSTPLEPEKTERVREYFIRRNITPHRLSCTLDRYGRMTVELVVLGYQEARISKQGAALDLCALLDADFDPPEVTPRERHTTFTFREKAAYTVETGAYQLAGGGNRMCGDAYEFIRNKGGCAHLLLSDGMGSGGSAAVDSNMTCGLLGKLISVGVGYEAALGLVNSALLVKSGDETLSTVDICSLDLFSGKASFYKAGAAPSFLLKGGKAGYVESSSLPAGILHGVSFEKSSITLHEGDIIVMVSDGVTGAGADWIKSELPTLKDTDMQSLCESLAATAKERRSDGHDDDITVLAATLRRC